MRREKRERAREAREGMSQSRARQREEARGRAAKRETGFQQAFTLKPDPAKKLLSKKGILETELSETILKKASKLASERYLAGLDFLQCNQPWVRPLEDWKPKGKAADTQFRSLVHHLVVKYPVPRFLYSVFWEDGVLRHRGVDLFLHLARGGSLRKALQPDVFPTDVVGKKGSYLGHPMLCVPLTKRMCHTFMQSTSEHTLVSAVRYAQVEAFNGNRRIAERVCATPLGRDFINVRQEDFWQSMIQWACNQAMLDPAQVGPIIDWVRSKREEENGGKFSMPSGMASGQKNVDKRDFKVIEGGKDAKPDSS